MTLRDRAALTALLLFVVCVSIGGFLISVPVGFLCLGLAAGAFGLALGNG